MISWTSCCALSRRAFARNSRMVRLALSSMKIFASANFEAAAVKLGKSRSPKKPSRTFCKLTRAREQSRRCTSCWLLISKLNTPTESFSFIATCSAIFMASAVFPMLGRAAITIISEGCKPLVIRSNSTKPVEIPVMPPLRSYSFSIDSIASITWSFIESIWPLKRSSPTAKILCSTSSRRLFTSSCSS